MAPVESEARTDVTEVTELSDRLRRAIETVIEGKTEAVEMAVCVLLAGGCRTPGPRRCRGARGP